VSAAGHEVHGNYYTAGVGGAGAIADNGRASATWGYAVSGGFEIKTLPTGAGDSLKFEATWAKGAAKYAWGGTIDTSGAGRFARASGNGAGGSMAFGYVLDGVYTNGSSIDLSTAWDVSAYYEHYWTPQWRTSLFANYSTISYGAGGNAALIANLSSVALNSTGVLTATGGDMKFSTIQVGTRTAWQPVKDLTLSAEFIYTRMDQNLTGTYTSTSAVSGAPAGRVFTLGDQNVYNGAVQIIRSF
jgi:hypothetical protein